MTEIRCTSASTVVLAGAVLPGAMRLVRHAAGVGLLADAPVGDVLDLALLRRVASRAAAAGVGAEPALALLALPEDPDPSLLAACIDRLDGALTGSPQPATALPELAAVYGDAFLGTLVGISPASLRRYVARERAVPDPVAARIHFLALVTADLAGTWNAYGLRRWWDRPRTALGGRTPRAALGERWDPDERDAQAVAALAAALVGPAVAT
ncbi:MAG: hypothetical protein ACKOTZ_07205 [Chloroflexota bacterium]